jgi:hypothetical protein
MHIDVRILVFILLQRDIHLGLRGQVLHPGRQLGQSTL